MINKIEDLMKQWSDLVNEKTPQEDFWIETPIGNFKNPKFIPNDNEDVGKINITIQCDVWI